MTFPSDPLDAVVELAIGADIHAAPGTWSWTDVTVREAPKVTINRGRRNRIGNFPATRVQATADNTDGNLCRHNPLGTHFGLLKKNTPMRVRIDNGSGYVTRAAVYVPGFPPSWDPSERDQTVTLTGVGITDRLGRSKPLRSPLYRSIKAASPTCYWSLEDGSSATTGASDGSSGAKLTGTANFGNTSLTPVGGSAAVDLSDGGVLVASTGLTQGAATSWEFECNIGWDTLPTLSAAADLIVGFRTPGSGIVEWGIGVLELSSVPRFGIYRIAPDGTLSVGSSGTTAIQAGRTYHFRIRMEQNGANVDYTRWLDGVANGSGSEASVTLGKPTQVIFNPRGSATQMPDSVSHAAAWTPVRSSAETYLAADGFAGEMAHERVERLCTEERVPVTVTASTSQAMGPQSASRLVDLLRECANADAGLLFEDMNFGLTFVSSSERYNQSAAITLSYSGGQILPPWDPTDDDQDYYNRVTASRPGGSSATEADDDEIDEVGQYADQVNPNVETDDQLNDVAGWRLNLGLNDELTWPAVRPKVISGGSLLSSWLATDIGDQLHVTGHPSPLAPDTIRQIIEGYTETLGSYTYDVSVNLSPASPWDVAELDDDTLGKLDTDGSTLVTAVNSSATSLVVRTTNPDSPLWTTDAGEMPIPHIISGEVVSTTAITGALVDAFGRTVVNGWSTADSGQTWMLSGGTNPDDYDVTAGKGTQTNSNTNVYRSASIDIGSTDFDVYADVSTAATATGAALTSRVAGRFTDANNMYFAGVNWDTSGILLLYIVKTVAGVESILNINFSGPAYSAAQDWRIRFQGFGTTFRMKLWLASSSESAAWSLEATDSTPALTGTKVAMLSRRDTGNTNANAILRFDNVTVVNPQKLTVTRSVNGVAKSQAAGAAFNVYRPAKLAL